MIRSRTVNKIHELAVQGKSIQDIAISLGIARNTVRKYLRHPELAAMPHPRPKIDVDVKRRQSSAFTDAA